MPDWTYHPLRGVAARLLGASRSQRAALRTVATIARIPGGRHLVAALDGRRPQQGPGPVGVSVGPSVAADALAALPPLGAGMIEIGPLTYAGVWQLADALRRRSVPVALRVRASDARAVRREFGGLADLVVSDEPAPPAGPGVEPDVVVRDAQPELVARARRQAPAARLVAVSAAPDPWALVALLDAGADVVLTTPAALVESGPGLLHRAVEAALGRRHPRPPRLRDVAWDPRRWPGWLWGSLLGAGMLATALGAAAVTLGPVLLSYDRAFLGTDTAGLAVIDPRLVRFLQHDRITLSGMVAAIGVLYVGLSGFGIRRGWGWARDALLASGAVGFPTLLYLLGFHYLEPAHLVLTVALFPVFLAAVWRRPAPHWRVLLEGPERVRRRALLGQLLLIGAALGVIASGAVISAVGMTNVFVPSDLTFMGISSSALSAANPRLLDFIAHDRAGFGGALLAAGVAALLLTAWGWRRGEAWVWWTLLLASVAGLGSALAIHLAVGYVDFVHLLPVWAGIAFTGAGLALSRPYLCARDVSPAASTSTAAERKRPTTTFALLVAARGRTGPLRSRPRRAALPGGGAGEPSGRPGPGTRVGGAVP